MIGWTFLYVFLDAFLTFLAFITLLLAGASLVTGSIKRDRSLVVFGLKALFVTLLAVAILYAMFWQQITDWLTR